MQTSEIALALFASSSSVPHADYDEHSAQALVRDLRATSPGMAIGMLGLLQTNCSTFA